MKRRTCKGIIKFLKCYVPQKLLRLCILKARLEPRTAHFAAGMSPSTVIRGVKNNSHQAYACKSIKKGCLLARVRSSEGIKATSATIHLCEKARSIIECSIPQLFGSLRENMWQVIPTFCRSLHSSLAFWPVGSSYSHGPRDTLPTEALILKVRCIVEPSMYWQKLTGDSGSLGLCSI